MGTKSTKMYSSSPSIKRGEDGKVGIEKPSPASMDSMGLSGGVGQQGSMGEAPVHTIQQGERIAVLQRHENELREVHGRHIRELEDMHRRHYEPAGPTTGDHLIIEVKGTI